MTDKGKGSLPHGWTVRTSKNYPDRVYYFNLFTGSSTWECPELDAHKAVTKKKEKHSKMERLKAILESSLKADGAFSRVSEVKKGSLKKISEDYSSPNSCDSHKSHTPPTAVVVPVVHKRKLNSPAAASNQEQLNIRQLKRSKINDNDIPCTSKSVITERKRKKKRQKEVSVSSRSTSHVILPVENKTDHSENSTSESIPGTSSEPGKDIKDVEMQDVSLDLMDDLTSKKETVFDPSACFYIVVDTNILISELHLISELKDTPLDGCGPPHIFIPWVVIEELDKLKNHRNTKGTARAAAEAIRYLNTVLNNHPRIHGQSPSEEEEWSKAYSKCNDDKILGCCIALNNKMPPEKVILLTNDKNLVNKALICKVNVHNFESMMKKVKPDTVFNYDELKKDKKKKKEKERKTGCGSASSHISPDVAEERMLQSKRDMCKREIHTLMSNARLLLKDVLSKFLTEEMFDAYGKIWVKFPIETKLLKGVLDGIKKYWAVFSDFFSEKDKRNFELLHEKVSRPEGFMGEKDECLIILSTIEDVFRGIMKRRPKLRVHLELIQEYRVGCINAFSNYSETESSIRSAEEKCILALFDNNWNAINQLCGTILDFYNIPHSFDYNKFSGNLSEYEIRRNLINLYPGVQQIKNLMCCLFDAVKNCKPTKTLSKKLASALLQFIPSLQLQPSGDCATYHFFSTKALERFFTGSQNRQKIEIGIKQIETFFEKIDEALCFLLRGKPKSPEIETMICD